MRRYRDLTRVTNCLLEDYGHPGPGSGTVSSRDGLEEAGSMETLGFQLSPFQMAVACVGLGVALAVASLLVNTAWEAFKHCTGKFTRHGVRRCVACMEPAEPGSLLCAKHAAISNMVRGRHTNKAA